MTGISKMKDKRTNLTVGLILAAAGIAVLGTDRIIASANTTVSYGQTLTWATAIGLVLVVAAILFVSASKKDK